MSFVKAFVVFLSLSLSASALVTPHYSRGAHHHAVAACLTSPASQQLAVGVPDSAPVKRKRSLRKRCNPRHNTTSISTVAATPTATGTIANVGGQPSSSEAASTEKATTAGKATTTDAPQTTAEPKTSTHSTRTSTSAETKTTSSSSGGGSSNEPSYLVGTQTGDGTFYGTGLGACGITNTDSDHIAAVSHLLFDSFPGYTGGNPNHNPLCGKKVRATYQGKSVVVTLTDRCVGCALTDLDFSPTAFDELADPSVGRIHGMTWVWL